MMEPVVHSSTMVFHNHQGAGNASGRASTYLCFSASIRNPQRYMIRLWREYEYITDEAET